MAIPKIIHYCWLSGDQIPAEFQRCMDTWKKKLSGYEFILWDTQRFNIDSTTWTKQALETKIYAFAADYVRLFAVYHFGGIYLDMDIEVIKPFDELLDRPFFFARENNVNPGIEAGCFGAEQGNMFIKKCMEYYEIHNFFDPAQLNTILQLKQGQRQEFVNPPTLPEVMSGVMAQSRDFQKYELFPYTYFTTKNIMTGTIDMKEHTFTVHHFASRYHSRVWYMARYFKQKVFFRFGQKGLHVKILHHIIDIIQITLDDGLKKTLDIYREKIKRKISRQCL
jgi:mannosyltransferase OCH1-like enzyme